jgi:hypothetical protein
MSASALDGMRARAGAAGEVLAARSRAGREVVLLRRELTRLAGVRPRLLAALGDAAYRGDEPAAAAARAELEALDARAWELDAEVRRVVESAQERVRNAQVSVQPTEMVAIQEPYPPPDEGTPPMPAPVPEPYPPPDEGTPRLPEPVPEPGPGSTPMPDQE